MKRKATILSIVFVFVLLIAITPDHAKAATMPELLWMAEYVFVRVADLGMLGPVEWELCVITEWPSPTNFGIVQRHYYPVTNLFGMMSAADGYWRMWGFFGEWTGDGSMAYGRNEVGMVMDHTLLTSPPAIAGPSSSNFFQQ